MSVAVTLAAVATEALAPGESPGVRTADGVVTASGANGATPAAIDAGDSTSPAITDRGFVSSAGASELLDAGTLPLEAAATARRSA